MSLIVPGQPAPAKPSWKSYDDEFDLNLDPKTAAEVEAYEKGDRYETTGSQTKEEYYKWFEKNKNSRREHRFANQEELQLHREGTILHMNEFMRRLKSTGVNAWYTEKGGMIGTLGLYLSHEGLKLTCTHESGQPHYVGFVQVPFMQEFEELHFDRYDVPLGPKRRGWRTVLMRLREQGILTETQIDEAFGKPVESIISNRYLGFMKYQRNKTITG